MIKAGAPKLRQVDPLPPPQAGQTCCLTLFPAPRGARMTAVCLGTPRGGTSMVAGVMAGLGLPMGDGLEVNIEDRDFNPDHRKGDYAGFLRDLPSAIAARNTRHPVWGWKYPHAAHYLPDIAAHLHGPRLVIVLRDPVPATLRLLGSGAETAAALAMIEQREIWQRRNIALAQRLRWPCLLVSYEKAMAPPAKFVNELAGFLQLPPPDDAGVHLLCGFMRRGGYKPAPHLPERHVGDAE